MFIKQVSIFVENRKGRLEEITRVLADNDINIVCVSIGDTAEFGVLRMIVSNPAGALEALNKNGFAAVLTDVIGVKLEHHYGMLNKMAAALNSQNISLSYMYAINSGTENAAIIIKTSDNEKAENTIKAAGIELMDCVEAYNL